VIIAHELAPGKENTVWKSSICQRYRLNVAGGWRTINGMSETALVPPSIRRFVAVVMERVRLDNRWVDHRWAAKAVVPDVPPDHVGARVLGQDEERTEILFPGLALWLRSPEAEGYFLNLSSPEPKVFVLWRMNGEIARPDLVTVSYNEGARWLDSGEQVDSVALPAELMPWIAEFVAAHYKPEPKKPRRYASSKDRGVASRRDG
jgi:hypothetical protein